MTATVLDFRRGRRFLRGWAADTAALNRMRMRGLLHDEPTEPKPPVEPPQRA